MNYTLPNIRRARTLSVPRSVPSPPKVAMVLGSGLGFMGDAVEELAVSYRDIPHFKVSTAPGHRGPAGLRHSGRPEGGCHAGADAPL